MRFSTRAILKFSFVSISIALVSFGWITQCKEFAITGALVYLGKLIYDNIDLILESRKFKRGEEIKVEKGLLIILTDVLEGILIVSSLVASLSEHEIINIPGMIIWCGQIFSYVLFGNILSTFANIPMKMSHGGVWGIQRFYRRKKKGE